MVKKFSFMNKDTVIANLDFEGNKRSIEDIVEWINPDKISKRIIETALINGDCEFLSFLSIRCIDSRRSDALAMLSDSPEFKGVWDPYVWVRMTEGILSGDTFWIRWDDRKNLRWKFVKLSHQDE